MKILNKKTILLALLCCASNSFAHGQAEQITNFDFSEALRKIEKKSVYKELAELYIPSLTKQKLSENAHKQQTSNDKTPELPKLKQSEKIELLYTLLAQADTEGKSLFDTVCPNVFNDLELYCGSDPQDMEHSLFRKIDRTETGIGQIQLQKIFGQPLTSIDKLKERQKVIKLLTEQPELFDEINASLQDLKKCEDDFVWMWKQTHDEVKVFFGTVYFDKILKVPFDKLNTNEIALEAYGKSTLFILPVVMIASTLFTGALQGHTDKLYSAINDSTRNFKKLAAETQNAMSVTCTSFSPPLTAHQIAVQAGIAEVQNKSKTNTIERSFIRQVAYGQFIDSFGRLKNIPCLLDILKDTKHEKYDGLKRDPKTLLSISQVTAWYAVAPFMSIATLLYTVYYCYKSAKEYNQVSNLIHKKMLAIAGFVNALKQLGKQIEAHPELGALIPHEHLQTIQKNTRSLELILELLSTDTLKKQPSYFAFKGRILALFKLMYTIKDIFIESMQEAGNVDALMSIAKLYKEHSNSTNGKYCFAEYLQNPRPTINIENFWHPYIPPHIAVLNSFKNGYPNKDFFTIITGPNGGGKSTVLKALILAPWCAQTLTICPASKVAITPFARFNTYLNMVDHIGKESLFQAEVRRAGELLQMLKSLKTNEFALVIMDEIFTGTNAYEGEIGAYGIAKHFLDFDKVIALFATHFPKMPTLEADTNGVFKNYKVAVDILEKNKIKYTYKLLPGQANQHIALQILFNNQSFDQKKLHDAYDALAGA